MAQWTLRANDKVNFVLRTNLRRKKMANYLDGKVAIVTGSGRGIGAGVAKQLASEGAKVIVNDIGAALDLSLIHI